MYRSCSIINLEVILLTFKDLSGILDKLNFDFDNYIDDRYDNNLENIEHEKWISLDKEYIDLYNELYQKLLPEERSTLEQLYGLHTNLVCNKSRQLYKIGFYDGITFKYSL